jgi:hypothetical protein
MLSRRKLALVCAAVFVLGAIALAMVRFADGAWIQGVLWISASVGFGVAYIVSLGRWRRA